MNTPLRKFVLGLAAVLILTSAEGQEIQQYLERQVNDGPLSGAVVGVYARESGGNILIDFNSSTRMVPASNMKLVTTGAALHAFGPEYQFSTKIGYSGSIREDGTLKGDIYIIGGGDPTIGASDSTAYKADALFWKWKTILQGAGIKRIDGNIIGDGRAWEGRLEHIGWEYGDIGTYYGAGSSALCFYENTIDLEVKAGDAVGDSVRMRQMYPDTPWLKIQNKAVTGPAGSGNSLLLKTSDLSDEAVLDGTFAIDRKPKREQAANKRGALTCAYAFWQNLKNSGWEVSGTYASAQGNPDIKLIGESLSPSLAKISRKTNVDSDNFYAESILRAMGEAASGCSQYDSCLVAIKDVLADIVPSMDGIIQKDGSGLSRGNSLAARWMVDYLEAMEKSPSFPAFLGSLPRPGEGSIYNLGTLNPWKFRIKSGSMSGVLCYSGYVLDAGGRPRISFCILTNNLGCKLPEARTALEGLIQLFGKN